MQADDDDRCKLIDELTKLPVLGQIEAYGELQRGGRELSVWLLSESGDFVADQFLAARTVLVDFSHRFVETDVSLFLDTFEFGVLSRRAYLDSTEIERGVLPEPLDDDIIDYRPTVYASVNHSA